MRRWLALSLIALVALTTVGPARAQIPMIANGIIHATVASVNVANTTTEQLLYQYPIPAALIASWTSSNIAFGAAPIHLHLQGGIRTIGTVAGNVANLGVNLGGSLATFSVINAGVLPPDLGSGTACGGFAVGIGACQAPVALDVYISPIATLTSQNCTDLRPCQYSLYMAARFVAASTAQSNVTQTWATETVFNVATLGTINVLQPQTLNVLWRWGAAASGNSLNIYNGVLKLGY
jgi:hypothetical protein